LYCITSSTTFNSGGGGNGSIGTTEVCGENFDENRAIPAKSEALFKISK
jgi:hypothetical protein